MKINYIMSYGETEGLIHRCYHDVEGLEVAENLSYMFPRSPIGARLLTGLGSSFP